MTNKEHSLISEFSSPLFRTVWVHNIDKPEQRFFDNNACAFHIGNGYVLSIAHNLRAEAGYFKSIDEKTYQTDIIAKLELSQTHTFNKYYTFDAIANKRYLDIQNAEGLDEIITGLKEIHFDTRWISLYRKEICQPFLAVQFRDSLFYNDPKLTKHLTNRYIYDAVAQKHSYLIDLEFVEAFYTEDIALYRMKNVPPQVIEKIPSVEVDYTLLNSGAQRMYCLQSSPANEAGRLLNTAQLEGVLDHSNVVFDNVGGNYLTEGIRYLTKGYFRFGSSGAPYIVYNSKQQKFYVNAIQSEASPIQLSLGNNLEGNYQFVNAIATPLYTIADKLKEYTAA